MKKQLFLTFGLAFLLIIVKNNFAESPINKCEMFHSLRLITLQNIEMLKQEATLESALALANLYHFLSDKNSNRQTFNSRLKKLGMLNHEYHINSHLKEAFSDEIYAECKHIFEKKDETITSLDSNHEELDNNLRED